MFSSLPTLPPPAPDQMALTPEGHTAEWETGQATAFVSLFHKSLPLGGKRDSLFTP